MALYQVSSYFPSNLHSKKPQSDWQEQRSWEAADAEQRVLDNALVLWQRFVEENRRDVDEHAEQLRATAFLAALVAGFDLVALIQFSFDASSEDPAVLLCFGITNALTDQEAEYLLSCRTFAQQYKRGDRPPAPRRSFQSQWDRYLQPEWSRVLVMFSAGVAAFLINIASSGFIKFRENGNLHILPAALLAAPLAAGLAYYAVAHVRWLWHIIGPWRQAQEAEDVLKPAGLPYDWHLPSRPGSDAPRPLHGFGCSHKGVKKDEYLSIFNARLLWVRFVERNRNDVEERAEQLRSFSFLSGIIAGFAVASFLQLDFHVAADDPDHPPTPQAWQLGFAISVGLTAGLATCSMAMCSLILMSILKTGPGMVSEEEEAVFMAQCSAFATGYQPGMRPPAPRRTFRTHWHDMCSSTFAQAFCMFTGGLIALQVNLIFAFWIKYTPAGLGTAPLTTPVASTAFLVAGLAYLMAANARWAPFLGSVDAKLAAPLGKDVYPEFRPAGLPWDWHLPAVPRLPSGWRPDALRPRQTMREMLSQMAPRRELRLASLTTAPVR
ncbi:hypothetical protein WJX81_004192 [Elliptochloris bilobata]|uniref:Uncharacterized protein n=1 Tax=Elliptochloris bilobata TaxID=381761 RepID=A0AAW1SFU7_9CHLO